MKKYVFLFLVIVLLALCTFNNADAGKIVLANDEWTLSNAGFFSPNDPGLFATNVASWFTNSSTGNFLAYSNNFGLTESQLASSMTGAGHGWTVSTNTPFDVNTLLGYDGIFLAGDPVAADTTVLTQYVNAGGNVYLAGGTGWGGAAAEAAQWNPFLNNFNLGFGSVYNGVGSWNVAINSGHTIFSGVDSLYNYNGNDTLELEANGPDTEILVSSGGHDLYAVYDATPIPEPATMLLLGSGIAGLIGFRKKFKS